MTGDEVLDLVTAGQFWWMRPDGSMYATMEKTPVNEADRYLLNASPAWASQWNGDWEAAAAQLTPLLERSEEA